MKPSAQRRGKGFFSKRDFNLLLKLACQWEVEANRCAEARAYYGACILAAASIEATLLATCDLLPAEARKAAATLNMKLRGSIAHLGLAEPLNIATTAGWLAADKRDSSEPDILVVTDLVRSLRNLAHPGKLLREVRRVPLPRSAFRVAWYTIDAVREQLAGKLGIKLPSNRAPD
jgi:hypothetical protein